MALLRDTQTRFFLLTVLLGVGAGAVALGVRSLSALVTHLAFARGPDMLAAVRAAPAWLRLVAPALGGAVAGYLSQRATRGTGSAGMSAIMEAVTLERSFVSLRRTLGLAFASVIAMSTGGSIGREGPIVQLSSAWGSRLGRWFGLSEMRVRVLVLAGVGAGMAAAYNTPISGTLFVLEVVAGSFATDLIGPTVVAATIGTLVSRIYLWKGPIYKVPEFVLVSPQELVTYAALGLAAGLMAMAFMGSLRLGEGFFKRTRWPRWATAGLGGLAVGLVTLHLPEVCGNGYDTLVHMLNERPGLFAVALLLVAKMFATTASVTSGSPGGVFTPTLFIGAALGGVVGNFMHFLFPNTTGPPGSYALVGMGALLAATTRAPITATVLIAELTGNYVVVLPLLLSNGLAAMLTRKIDSVYTHELRKRGITWEGTLEQKIVMSRKARDIMKTDAPVLRPETPFEEVVRLFTTTRAPCLYVVDANGSLTGLIELHAVKGILAADELSSVLIAQDLTEPARSVQADASLATVNEKLWFIDTGEIAVVENGPGSRYLGVVTRRDLLGFLDREILRRNLLLSEVRWRDGLEKGIDYLELPEGYRLEAIPVPQLLVGMTMAQAQLRSRHGLNVIAVMRTEPNGTERRFQPASTYTLLAGDRLVAVGSTEDLETFQQMNPQS
jgi:CIC family chloride channel protein